MLARLNRILLLGCLVAPGWMNVHSAAADASPGKGGVTGVGGEALFERDVLPILTSNCLGCHGGLKQKGGLDMRTIPLMVKGGENGAGVVVGDPGHSLVWTQIESGEMPKGDKKLSPVEKEAIRGWITARLPTVAERRRNEDPLLEPDRQHAPAEVAGAIDKHIDAALADAGLSPSGPGDDAEFLRRVYLDLTGRVPTAEQAEQFLDDAAPDKRPALIDRLLTTPEFGEQFGRTWRDWIAPPELPSDPNGGKQPHRETQNLGAWLGKQITAGEKWDAIVQSILTVEGPVGKNPQGIFFPLLGEGGYTTPEGTARGVASLFMGVQLQCAQCHDDPYRDWAQDEYWATAAFFRETEGDFGAVGEAGKVKVKTKKGKQASVDKSPAGRITIPPSAFKNAGRVVPAHYLHGAPAAEAEQAKQDATLRRQFAQWLTAQDNPYFARAFANRTWSYFFNRGIVHPVDDMRDLNPPSHPGLLKLLANEFRTSGFDVKHLVRGICNSRAYQRTSLSGSGVSEAEAARLAAAFGRMPLRVMSADQLYDSLKLAYGDAKLDLRPVDAKDGNAKGESAAIGDAYLEFQRTFCTNEEDKADFTHGIPQLLATLNHPRLTAGSKTVDDLLKQKPSADEIVERLYLATLSRRPDAAERDEAVQYLAGAADPAGGAVGLLWMLVNRSEFLLVR